MKTRLVPTVFTLMLMPVGMQLFAQDQPYDQQIPPYAQQQQQQQYFSPQQLESLVAPIALYPDALLSQVLVASTYPQEIMEANQWLLQTGGQQGQNLIEAAQQQNWDPSVQALAPFQDVITRMASDERWTTDLGNAFLAQQADVMSAVQRLRVRAQQSGRLTDTAQQRVVIDNQGGETAIEIEPANPEVVYVPNYNPSYFWGDNSYYPWPSLYYPSAGYGWGWGRGINIGFSFGGWGGWGGWGWHPGWFNHSVVVNNRFFDRYNYRRSAGGYGFRGNTVWAHDPGHRLGVPYRNGAVAQRFGGQNFRSGNQGYQAQGFRSGNQNYGGQNLRNNQNYGVQALRNNNQGYGGQNFRNGIQNYGGQTFRNGGNSYQPGNNLRVPQQTVPYRSQQPYGSVSPRSLQQSQPSPAPQVSSPGNYGYNRSNNRSNNQGYGGQSFSGQNYRGGGSTYQQPRNEYRAPQPSVGSAPRVQSSGGTNPAPVSTPSNNGGNGRHEGNGGGRHEGNGGNNGNNGNGGNGGNNGNHGGRRER
jgi:hypothetical protein